MARTRNVLLLLLATFAGCAGSEVARRYEVPAARADTRPVRWEYNCQRTGDNITELANRYGQQGWELAAAAGNGDGTNTGMVWCFKRPLP